MNWGPPKERVPTAGVYFARTDEKRPMVVAVKVGGPFPLMAVRGTLPKIAKTTPIKDFGDVILGESARALAVTATIPDAEGLYYATVGDDSYQFAALVLLRRNREGEITFGGTLVVHDTSGGITNGLMLLVDPARKPLWSERLDADCPLG